MRRFVMGAGRRRHIIESDLNFLRAFAVHYDMHGSKPGHFAGRSASVQ